MRVERTTVEWPRMERPVRERMGSATKMPNCLVVFAFGLELMRGHWLRASCHIECSTRGQSHRVVEPVVVRRRYKV